MTRHTKASDPQDKDPRSGEAPSFSAVVVHWNDLDHLRRLLGGWNGDAGWELLVVDNSGGAQAALGELASRARWLEPLDGDGQPLNLGFGGGANLGARKARGEWVLLLNPDASPRGNALERLAAATKIYPGAGGLVPAMVDGGESLHRWQLQRLPSARDLRRKTWPKVPVLGPVDPPAAGTPIEQPAAAALLLRRSVFLELGGFDGRFHPAWFEDVDLAKHYAEDPRLADEARRLRYVPEVVFEHAGGATIGPLGAHYPWIHFCNLDRYVAKHHPKQQWQIRGAMVLGALLKSTAFLLLAPRKLWGQCLLVVGVSSGFRWPRRLRRLVTPTVHGGDLR